MIYNPETNVIFWDNLLNYPEFKALKETPQNDLWHREGDAFAHTCMVTQKMLEFIDMQNNIKYSDPEYRQILVYSALFHDFGKTKTTQLGEDGLYHCRNHAIEGVSIAQKFMMDNLELSEYVMTAVLSMVRYHMQPLYIMTNKDPKKALHKLLNNLYGISIFELLLLKWCDCEGAWQEQNTNHEEILLQVKDLYLEEFGFLPGTEVQIKKISDKNTNSPINVGDIYTGKLQFPVTIGWRTSLGFKLSTSPVVKIIDKNSFETMNSLYEIKCCF